MSKAFRKLESLAERAPSKNHWATIISLMDKFSVSFQAKAVARFEEVTSHWPVELLPWTELNHWPRGFTPWAMGPGMEQRRSPSHWTQEIYRGEHAPKHRLIRVFDSCLRLRRGEKTTNLLAPESEVERVVQLNFDQARIPTAFFKALKGEGAWRRWRTLRLESCNLKPGPLKALAKAELSAMEDLGLTQDCFGPEGVKALLKAPGFSALRGLDLGGNSIGSEGAAHLAQAHWLPQLERLGLINNGLDDEALNLLTAGDLGGLRWLDLRYNNIGVCPKGWVSGLSGLRSLNLASTSIMPSGLETLIDGLPELEDLSLSKAKIGDRGAEVIAQADRRWRSLVLDGCQLSSAGLKAILISPVAVGLKRLFLGSGLDMENARLLSEGACPELEYLWFYGPETGDGATNHIRNSSNLKTALPY